ncbi:MAG: VOC family protein [Acidimicrobiales bacterium]
MVEYGGSKYPDLCPYIYYEDIGAALDFLATAFGFEERMRQVGEDGTFGHCEMQVGDSVIMMGAPPGFKAPVDPITVGLYVAVDDVDAHHARARDAEANIQTEPEDMPYGVRSYGVLDPEGHQWWFFTPAAD